MERLVTIEPNAEEDQHAAAVVLADRGKNAA
jgi:hypothetical protein